MCADFSNQISSFDGARIAAKYLSAISEGTS